MAKANGTPASARAVAVATRSFQLAARLGQDPQRLVAVLGLLLAVLGLGRDLGLLGEVEPEDDRRRPSALRRSATLPASRPPTMTAVGAELLGEVEGPVDLVAGVRLPPERAGPCVRAACRASRAGSRRPGAALLRRNRPSRRGRARRRAWPGGGGRRRPSARSGRAARRAARLGGRGRRGGRAGPGSRGSGRSGCPGPGSGRGRRRWRRPCRSRRSSACRGRRRTPKPRRGSEGDVQGHGRLDERLAARQAAGPDQRALARGDGAAGGGQDVGEARASGAPRRWRRAVPGPRRPRTRASSRCGCRPGSTAGRNRRTERPGRRRSSTGSPPAGWPEGRVQVDEAGVDEHPLAVDRLGVERDLDLGRPARRPRSRRGGRPPCPPRSAARAGDDLRPLDRVGRRVVVGPEVGREQGAGGGVTVRARGQDQGQRLRRRQVTEDARHRGSGAPGDGSWDGVFRRMRTGSRGGRA